ncbi:hypothetical protein [Streptomyces sp. URMC 125]|uniref:hypothetical protein n=1 Tax=Streptomyces sp. URMC 125 TaxID=3423419 RepID=UPI003F1A2FDA
MAGIAQCPSCGESEDLRGEPSDGDIKITCLRCEAQWMRGAPRCAGCGGTDIVERPQAMTRHSRGTQLSIIGWRELLLCRVCDAEALETSIAENLPVPSDYVAVCLLGREDRTAAPPRPRPMAAGPARGGGAEEKPCGERAPDRPEPAPATTAPAPAPAKPRTATRPRPGRAKPAPSQVPTVRQAVAAFLAESSGTADATAMLLLGTHLGSYNRLTVLDEAGAADRLTEWCDGHWPDRGGDTAGRALDTIRRAIDFWGARGWLTTDPAAGIR